MAVLWERNLHKRIRRACKEAGNWGKKEKTQKEETQEVLRREKLKKLLATEVYKWAGRQKKKERSKLIELENKTTQA